VSTNQPPIQPATYQATCRRSELAIPGLLAVLILFGIGLWWIVTRVEGRNLEAAILSLGAGTVLALGLILLTVLRVHRWTLEPAGIRIEERPRVPLMGWRRRAFVPFAAIAGMRRIESGFERLIEIATHGGRFHRLPQIVPAGASLESFAAAIDEAARRAGRALPAIGEGLSFWNTAPGIAVILVLLAISCVLAGATAFALWDGLTTATPGRTGYAAAIVLLLPVGCLWLLRKSLARRRLVLGRLPRG
jgi:hypothetical protein